MVSSPIRINHQSSQGARKSISGGSTPRKHVVETVTPPNKRHSGGALFCEACEGSCKMPRQVNGRMQKRTGLFKRVCFVKAPKIVAGNSTKRRLAFNDSSDKDDSVLGKRRASDIEIATSAKKKKHRSSFSIAREQIRKLANGNKI